jgi:hypothetical protein
MIRKKTDMIAGEARFPNVVFIIGNFIDTIF